MDRFRRRSYIFVLGTYVALVSFYFGPFFISSTNNDNIIVAPLLDAPYYFTSPSASVNSLIDQLRDKLLEGKHVRKRGTSNKIKLARSNNGTYTTPYVQRTILCCIAMHEEAYIDEFVDYHLGIGFRKVIVYDNSDHYELKQWGDKRNQRKRNMSLKQGSNGVTTTNSSFDQESVHADTNNNEVHVIHHPGKGKQSDAYLDCAQRAYNDEFGTGIENAAFWDVDEFLILKQHTTVDELLEEYMINKGASSLSINWYMFRHGNRHVYEPLPVTKRFLYRERKIQAQIKSLVRLEDMDMSTANHPHYPQLKNDTLRIDTNGTQISGMWNFKGPSNIAILHHYKTKSYAEYIKKRERGRAAVANWNPDDRHEGYEKNINEAVDEYIAAMHRYNATSIIYNGEVDDEGDDDDINFDNTVYDDTAWVAMKRVCPKYALYDLLDEI